MKYDFQLQFLPGEGKIKALAKRYKDAEGYNDEKALRAGKTSLAVNTREKT